MSIPNEAYEILILVGIVAVAMAVVSYVTKSSNKFRSRRSKRARRH